MHNDRLKTLFHPFVTGVLDLPPAESRVLFLNAEAGAALPPGFAAELKAVQPFRPLFRALEAQRFAAAPVAEGEDYDMGLLLLTKHKGENEARLIEAVERVRNGGWILVAGSKEDGIQPLRKRLDAAGIATEHMPKYHGVVFWFTRPEDTAGLTAAFPVKDALVDGRFRTATGMFSHDRIDAGSELLASRLPTDFSGDAADFGAGWGYLAVELAARSPRTERLDLYEAHYGSLGAAKANLAASGFAGQSRAFWHDLAHEPVKDRYDLIVMNPPFHEGHAAEPGLGQAFIRTAASALRANGRLMLVANRGLPYETAVAEAFRESGETCRNARFKVLWGRK